jgi:hypothetical protein
MRTPESTFRGVITGDCGAGVAHDDAANLDSHERVTGDDGEEGRLPRTRG